MVASSPIGRSLAYFKKMFAAILQINLQKPHFLVGICKPTLINFITFLFGMVNPMVFGELAAIAEFVFWRPLLFTPPTMFTVSLHHKNSVEGMICVLAHGS